MGTRASDSRCCSRCCRARRRKATTQRRLPPRPPAPVRATARAWQPPPAARAEQLALLGLLLLEGKAAVPGGPAVMVAMEAAPTLRCEAPAARTSRRRTSRSARMWACTRAQGLHACASSYLHLPVCVAASPSLSTAGMLARQARGNPSSSISSCLPPLQVLTSIYQSLFKLSDNAELARSEVLSSCILSLNASSAACLPAYRLPATCCNTRLSLFG